MQQMLTGKLYSAADWLEALLKSNLPWWLVVGGGTALRLWQYVRNPSLGHDEASLVINIVKVSFAGMLKPLPLNTSSTVAPILFMYIERAVLLALGNKDYVLRLFPLLAGLAGLWLLYQVARRYLGAAGLFALAALALSDSHRYYSTLAKQYGTDAALALLLVYLAGPLVDDDKPATRRLILLGAAGAIGIWISHPIIFVLAAIGIMMMYQAVARRDRAAIAATALLGAAWVISFGASYMALLNTLVSNDYLSGYWQAGFMPMPPWANLRWPWDTYLALLEMTTTSSSLATALGWLALIVVGANSLLARKRTLGWAIVLMALAALAASALHKYPLRNQFVIFLVPFVYLTAAAGLERIFGWLRRWNREAAGVAYAAMVVFLLWPGVVSAKRELINPRPSLDNMRPIVEYLAAHAQPSDAVLVSGGGASYAYYAQSYGLDLAETRVWASRRVMHYFGYRDELKRLSIRERIWIVFAYFEEQSYQHQRYEKYLNRTGEILDVYEAGRARVYLWTPDR